MVLCITGAEALYADMGHFGRKSIISAWLVLVYPALTINYFGQGAKILSGEPIAHGNLFYSLAPQWALLPLVVLATLATIIASQALISGAFSLTKQAISLGLFPRLRIVHTNPQIEGQIYLPFINRALLIGCVLLVLGFQNSSRLAAAYGIAVTGTMFITTLAFFILAYYQWRWPLALIGTACLLFGLVDLTFFGANLFKFSQGGWVPILIALILFIIMHTWQWGRQKIIKAHAQFSVLTVEDLLSLKQKNHQQQLNRSVVVMASRPVVNPTDKLPIAISSFCQKWGLSVPKHLIFLSVVYLNQPRVAPENRYWVTVFQKDEALGSIFSVQVNYGYMQMPKIRDVLEELKSKGMIKIPADPQKWLILTSMERFITPEKRLIDRLRLSLFRSILNTSKPITSYFGLGNDPQVVIENINI